MLLDDQTQSKHIGSPIAFFNLTREYYAINIRTKD
jgi:hypothetical protein